MLETRAGAGRREESVGSALRNQNLWLTLLYVSLILLISRTYA
jgi:hypothetical protein